MENVKKPKITWQVVAVIFGVMVFAYGILYAVVGTPQSSKLAEKNRIELAVQAESIRSVVKQLDRIERKLDDYAKRNGDSK